MNASRDRKRASNRSLKATPAFRTFVLDQLEELGDVTSRSMFGGVGLYCRGLFFGIIARDTLYFKVDDRNRSDYERAGTKAFRPYSDRPGTMRYYAVPLDVLESAPELTSWARKAVAGGAW
jgi:DNA transformation protein